MQSVQSSSKRPTFHAIFQDTSFNDPGINFFKVYYCVGTGDCFFIMPGLATLFVIWNTKYPKLQKEIDLELNAYPKEENLLELESKKDESQEATEVFITAKRAFDLKVLKDKMDEAALDRLSNLKATDEEKINLLDKSIKASEEYLG